LHARAHYGALPSTGNGDASTPEHMLLRFALSTGLLLAASLSQYLFMWAFWQRRIKDRVWQFVDLLAVSPEEP
jgi:hypothetical protein